MSDKLPSELGADRVAHGNPVWEGISTALNWFTVLPLTPSRATDILTGTWAMRAYPLAGIAAGLVALPMLLVAPLYPLLAGALTVALWAGFTRAMHLDGLADVADALGSYASPERAREILRDPRTGSMGVVSLISVILISTVALAQLYQLGLAPVALLAPFSARIAASVGTWRSFRPTSKTGFGALIVGTASPLPFALWFAGLTTIAFLIGSPLVAAIAAVSTLVAWLCLKHFQRRFDGINGDCFGAACEIASTTYLTLAAICAGIPSLWVII